MFQNTLFGYDVIIAHGPGCNDGATSAWCVWRTLPRNYRDLLSKEGGFYTKPEREGKYSKGKTTVDMTTTGYVHPNSPEGARRLQERGFPVVFVFIQPSEGVPFSLIENKQVLIIDLDMGDALIPVVQRAKFVMLVDHHDSTHLTISKHYDFLLNQWRNKFALFVNTSKSECGATLTWKLTHSAEIHPFVQIVRIGDTWQWNDYPELQARFVHKALCARRVFRSFPDIEETYLNWDKNFEYHVQKGRSLLEYETVIIKLISKQCDIGFIQTNDGTIFTVAYTQANVLHSEVGSTMKWYAQQRFKVPIHFCATWKYVSYKRLVSVSLRDGAPGINLAAIARNIKGSDGKGGGHDKAAGFSFYGLENFHNFILKSNPVELQPNQNFLVNNAKYSPDSSSVGISTFFGCNDVSLTRIDTVSPSVKLQNNDLSVDPTNDLSPRTSHSLHVEETKLLSPAQVHTPFTISHANA